MSVYDKAEIPKITISDINSGQNCPRLFDGSEFLIFKNIGK